MEISRSVKVFTLFPALPAELRVKIWHEAFEASAIAVECLLWPFDHRSVARRPPAFDANRESRAEALKLNSDLRNKFSFRHAWIATSIHTAWLPLHCSASASFERLTTRTQNLLQHVKRVVFGGNLLGKLEKEVLKRVRRLAKQKTLGNSYRLNDCFVYCGRVEVWTFRTNETADLDRSRVKNLLKTLEAWFLEVVQMKGCEHLRVPKQFRVTGSGGILLGSLKTSKRLTGRKNKD